MNNPSKIIRKVAIWAVIVAFGCLLVISVRRNALLENSLILMADENSNSDLDETALIADDSFGEVDGLADEPDAKAVTPKKQLELRLAPKVKASNGNSNDAIATNPQSNANETSVPSTAEDEIIAKREDELLSLEMELQELSAKLGPMHPKLRALKIKIEMLVDWLKEHQRTNNRTLVLKIHDGLQPVQVTSVLRELFVQKANVTCNDSRDRVFATVTGTTTRAETLSVMNEIENAAKRLGCVPEVSSVRHRDGFPTDEQDAEFDRQAKQLALEFRNAKPEEKTQIRSKLEAITKNHFFYRQQRRKREFESLGQRVDKLKAMHARREANRADIIRRRMDELLDPEADLKWDLIEAKAVEVVDSTNSTTEKPELRAASSPLSESPNLPGQNEKAKSPAPTYNGMTLDEAVHLMVTDRNLEKLTDAVLAANHLYDLGDPRELVRAVLQMMRFSGSVGINVGRQHVGLNEASVVLFLHFPSDLVIEEIVTELKHEGKRKPVRDFFLFFLRNYSSQVDVNGSIMGGRMGQSFSFDRAQMRDSVDRLSREIQINSNQIIATIVEIARQDASNGSWAVNCFQAIVTSCKQPISTFPEAIPIVELVLEIPESDGEPIWGSDRVAQFVAARLLGASNIRVNDVIQFATRRFEAADRDVKNLNDPVQRQPGTNYLRGIDCLIAVAPHDRKAVRILSDTLRAEWPKVIDQLDRLDTHQTGVEFDRRELVARSDFCFQIVNALKRIQPPAVEAISVLTEIVDSPKASKVMGPSDTPNQMGGMGSGGGYLGAGGGGNSVSLRERIINTIKQIQFANPAAVMTRQSDAELTAKSKPDDEHSKLTVRTLLDMPPLVGYSFLYLMEVTNDHDDAATDVLIEQSRPDNTEITDSLPAYESLDQNRIVWRIKSIGAHETVRLAVKGMPGDVGQFLNDAKGVSANLGKVINPNPSAMEIQEKPQPKLNQPTYDGQAYSEWLRILNTERQPKKLADAMEACGRLVAKGDERLIARGIFQVEAIFEHDNRQAERDEVRNAGKSALLLLPSDDVVAELLNAIRDPISYQNGRSFQAEFLKQIKYSTQVDSYRLKVDEIVNQILKVLPSQLTSRDGDLIAALSTAWRISQRSMSDFDGLSSVLIKVVKDGFSENTDSAGPGIPYNAWFEIVTNIVEREPEAPDLAILLAQHAVKVADIQSTHSSWIIASLIAQLGKHGEPAVPILVDLFLSESKKWEALRRSDWNESSVNTAVSGGRPMREWEIRTSIIGALGQIGIGAKGYELLKQLKFRIIPPQAIPHQAGGDQFVLSVTPAIEAAFKKYSIPKEGESCEVVLTDSLSLNGKWQLKKILSDKQEPTPDFVMNIRSGELLLGIIAGRRGGRPGRTPIPAALLAPANNSASGELEEEPSSSQPLKMLYGTTGQYLVKLDESTTPKSITLHQDVILPDGGRASRELEGIYELTDSSFTIQIARAKLPRPKEFAANPAQLPEGNVHLQFERKLPIELQEP